MKHCVLIFLLFCFGLSLHAASQVSVQVVNPTDRDFRISYEQNVVTGQKRIFRVNLQEDNSASFELNLPNRIELLMTYGGVQIPLYIGPNDKLSIRIDAAQGLSSIQFGGGAAAENEFLAAFAKTFPSSTTEERGGGFLPFLADRAVLAEAATGDVASFRTFVDQQLSAKQQLISSNRGKVDQRLLDRYQDRAEYQAETQKIVFLIQNQRSFSPADIRSASQRLGIKSLPTTQDPIKLENDDFKSYLRAYAQYLILPNNAAHDESTGDQLFQAIRENIERPWRHYLQSELLVNAFDFLGNPNFGLDHYPAMKRDGVQEVYRQRVENAYGDVINLAPDALAPNIGMYTTEGQPMSLTDLSGKVVYISFWASWCKPCIENFKKYDPIRQKLQQKGIVLLNVDIDDDEYAWKRALSSVNPRGENVRATHIEDLKRAYNLGSIPAYYIIDKHGKIVVLPEGENRDLLAAFDEILKR